MMFYAFSGQSRVGVSLRKFLSWVLEDFRKRSVSDTVGSRREKAPPLISGGGREGRGSVRETERLCL
jgi:hypothetical protein